MAESHNLPRPPTGGLLQWILRAPGELIAYLRFVFALSRLSLVQGSQKFVLKVAEENAVLEAEETTAAPVDPGTPGGGTIGLHTLYVPAAAILPTVTNGCAAVHLQLSVAGRPNVFALAFDPDSNETSGFSVQMPKRWDKGTVTAQFLWSHPATTTNFGVTWRIRAVAISDAGSIDVTYGTEQTVTDTGGTTHALYISSATSPVTIGGSPANGSLIMFDVARVAADGGDNLAVDAYLIGVRIQYTTDAETDD